MSRLESPAIVGVDLPTSLEHPQSGISELIAAAVQPTFYIGRSGAGAGDARRASERALYGTRCAPVLLTNLQMRLRAPVQLGQITELCLLVVAELAKFAGAGLVEVSNFGIDLSSAERKAPASRWPRSEIWGIIG